MSFRSVLACALLVSGGAANAVPITFTIDGVVDSVSNSLAGSGVSVGNAFSVTYTFESDTPARAGSTSTFAVFDALTQLSFAAGASSGSSTAGPEIQVDDNPGLPFHDRYGLTSRSWEGLTGPALNGLNLTALLLRLDDTSDTVFSDALVLPTSLSFSDFSSGLFFLVYGNFEGVASGYLTGIRTVPEPSMLVLFALGLLGMAVAVRRKALSK